MISRRTCIGLLASSALAETDIVVDIHQHTNYQGRTDKELLAHQKMMGVTKTVLLPAGSKYGLAVNAGGNDSAMALARAHPRQFVFFANEVPDLPEARSVIGRYLKAGAVGIGEQKFGVDSDSVHIEHIAALAAEYSVPVLLHFQHNTYNLGYERFYKILEKYPKVNFIGHAQTFWGNIDKHLVQTDLYPKGKVTPGGWTDRYLRDYPNMFGDLSAGSGLNALRRDEDHAKDFLLRHQNKLIYGSDCDDKVGAGSACSGSQCLALVRKLVTDNSALRKILSGNAMRIIKMPQ